MRRVSSTARPPRKRWRRSSIRSCWPTCAFAPRKKGGGCSTRSRASVRTPKAWLSGTVVNLCRRWIEDRVRWRGPDVDTLDRPCGGGDAETTLVARDALSRVDARTRRLCELIAVEGLRYDEVSDA